MASENVRSKKQILAVEDSDRLKREELALQNCLKSEIRSGKTKQIVPLQRRKTTTSVNSKQVHLMTVGKEKTNAKIIASPVK